MWRLKDFGFSALFNDFSFVHDHDLIQTTFWFVMVTLSLKP
jgi:hypothetical protein